MKTLLKNVLLLMLAIFLTNDVYSQGAVWATVKNPNQIIEKEEWQILDAQYNLSIEQALPSSRNQKLLEVYEIKCDCDVNDLYVSMVLMDGVDGVEYGPTYKSLEEPIDYSTFVNYNVPSNSPSYWSHWPLKLTNAAQAWNFSKGDSATVAISDQNYWVNHEELVGKVVYYDTTNTSSQGHGTVVAIVAAGNTNNALNVNGLGLASHGYNTKLALYRMNYNEVLEASYSGYRVVNMSWTSGCEFNQYIQDAINEVYDNGTFLVAAAGNGSTCGDPTSLVYPAAFDNVFAVSSVGGDDRHWNTFENGGTHQHNESVDIMAPGYLVPISAAPNWYLFGSGTSYAAPMVTGTVGLMISLDPTITNEEIDSILRFTARNIDDLNPDYIGLMGAGRLNSGYAVSQVQRNLDIENGEDDPIIINDSEEGKYSEFDEYLSIIENSKSIKDIFKIEGVKVFDVTGKEVSINSITPGFYLVVKDNLLVKKIIIN